MNWQSLGGELIRAGAPVIGRALGGPLGGMIGDAIGGVLANTLGVDATPEAVDEALKTTPAGELQAKLSAAESEAVARWQNLPEIVKADADAQAHALAETAATMRAEAVSGDPVQRWWRPFYAFELTAECAPMWVIAIGDMMIGDGKIAAFVLSSQSLLSVYWGARFGVLGVFVGGRSWEKVAADKTTVEKLAPSVIDQIVKAARRK